MADTAVKIPFAEAAAPSTPAANKVVIYAKSDGLMYSKDDAGTETLMSGGSGSGIPATIFDAKGDIIAASAADTAARLAAGSNGTFLQAQSGESSGLLWASGTVVRVTNSGNIALTQNADTYLAFDTDRHDPNGFHNTSTNTTRLTVPTGFGGNYLIGLFCECTASLGLGQWVTLRLNGTTVIGLGMVPSDSAATIINCSWPYPLAAADYVEVAIRTSATSKNVIFNDILEPIFWLVRLP